MPRPYPPEFRQRALDLVRSGRPVPEVAKLLGIAESCLYRWKKQDLIDRGLPGTSRAESAELVAARRKIRDLEEENKILRKAAAAVREVVPPKERYRLVAELVRSIRHAWLTDLIGQVHDASYGTYGQPRVSRPERSGNLRGRT